MPREGGAERGPLPMTLLVFVSYCCDVVSAGMKIAPCKLFFTREGWPKLQVEAKRRHGC